jgi:DNA-binding CsgD family transcriptional regulator
MQVIASVVKILDGGEAQKRPKSAPPRIRRKLHLTESQMQDLVASYLCGATTVELAAQHGIHYTTVSKYLKQRGVAIRLKSLGEKDVALVIEMYRAGLSTVRVAEKIGRAPNTVRAALLAAGVQMRDVHGRGRDYP